MRRAYNICAALSLAEFIAQVCGGNSPFGVDVSIVSQIVCDCHITCTVDFRTLHPSRGTTRYIIGAFGEVSSCIPLPAPNVGLRATGASHLMNTTSSRRQTEHCLKRAKGLQKLFPDGYCEAHMRFQMFDACRTAVNSGDSTDLVEALTSNGQGAVTADSILYQTLRSALDSEDLAERCIVSLAPIIILVVKLAQGLHTSAKCLGNSAVPESSWRSLWDFLSAIVLVQLELLGEQDNLNGAQILDMCVLV